MEEKARCQEDSENIDGLASKGVASALTDEDADVDGAMDDDNISEGQRKEQENEK